MAEENNYGITFVTIPGEVAFNPELTYTEKFVWWIIRCLDRKNHCFASNKFIANTLGTSEVVISKAISNLIKLEYIILLSSDRRKRKLKINKECFAKYNYLIKEFELGNIDKCIRRLYKNSKRQNQIPNKINKTLNKKLTKVNDSIYKSNSRLSLNNKDNQENKKRSPSLHKEGRKLSRDLYKEARERVFKNTKEKELFDYWQNLGIVKHKDEVVMKRCRIALKKAIRKVGSVEKIKEAMKIYAKILENAPGTVIRKKFPYKVGLEDFFEFGERSRNSLSSIRTKAKQPWVISSSFSWYGACNKGEEYVLNIFSKLIKDNNPRVTKKLKELWEDEIGFFDDIKNENAFRKGSDMFVQFFEKHQKYLLLQEKDTFSPIAFAKYIYKYLKSVEKEVHPGWLCSEVFYEAFPKYLINQKFMRRKRR